MKKTIYETAADTARKVRTVLKKSFPNVKFSVRSSVNRVSIQWTDGPLKPDVTDAVIWMESKKRNGSYGYEWEGERFVGADYISVSRTLSYERYEVIRQYVHDANPQEEHKVYEFLDAERKLIQTGVLDGPQPVVVADHLVSAEEPESAKIIPFPVQRAEPTDLTPEQKLKYKILQLMHLPYIDALMDSNGERIDNCFKQVALLLFDEPHSN